MSLWDLPDFDAHEAVQFVCDRESGLRAIIGIHSTHRGPAGGGTRFWHYADPDQAVADVLRLSRGMSYKNAMAGLAMGGGKAVILADAQRTKTPGMLAAFGRAVDRLCGAYVTAEDVGISVADMVAVREQTRHVSGLPVAEGSVGGDPGPHTSLGVYLGVRAALKRALGKDSLSGLHLAIQGAGSVASGLARLAAKDGARISIADIDAARAQRVADEVGGTVVDPGQIMSLEADVLSPNALGAILDEQSIAALRVPVVAGGANNQLARPEDGDRLQARGILYAPDYVINAGGIINVATEYLKDGDQAEVRRKIEQIPVRLEEIWTESAASGRNPAAVADLMAQRLIGPRLKLCRGERADLLVLALAWQGREHTDDDQDRAGPGGERGLRAEQQPAEQHRIDEL
jgi:leucine dehydrogenase